MGDRLPLPTAGRYRPWRRETDYGEVGTDSCVWTGAFHGCRCNGGVLAKRGSSGIFAGVSITVTVENDTIKLPIHVPDGTRLEITLPEEG